VKPTLRSPVTGFRRIGIQDPRSTISSPVRALTLKSLTGRVGSRSGLFRSHRNNQMIGNAISHSRPRRDRDQSAHARLGRGGTPRAFTSGRLAVLELLASQAAISLENAHDNSAEIVLNLLATCLFMSPSVTKAMICFSRLVRTLMLLKLLYNLRVAG